MEVALKTGECGEETELDDTDTECDDSEVELGEDDTEDSGLGEGQEDDEVDADLVCNEDELPIGLLREEEACVAKWGKILKDRIPRFVRKASERVERVRSSSGAQTADQPNLEQVRSHG
jgi:hypothetical protein